MRKRCVRQSGCADIRSRHDDACRQKPRRMANQRARNSAGRSQMSVNAGAHRDNQRIARRTALRKHNDNHHSRRRNQMQRARPDTLAALRARQAEHHAAQRGHARVVIVLAIAKLRKLIHAKAKAIASAGAILYNPVAVNPGSCPGAPEQSAAHQKRQNAEHQAGLIKQLFPPFMRLLGDHRIKRKIHRGAAYPA